jgi:hypothetical protein
MVTLIFVGTLITAFDVRKVRASGTIYIRADESIGPPTAPVSSVDNVTHIFTGNIDDSLIVERDNTAIEGLGYTLQGTGARNVLDEPDEINEDNADRYPLVNSVAQAATYETYVEVVPETMEFGDEGVDVIGTRFSVAVVVENVENLVGLDVTLRYNATYLLCVSHTTTIPVEDYLTAVQPSPHPGILHQPTFKVKDEVNTTLGEIWISCSSLPPAPSFSGSGTLFVATFEIVRQPLQPQIATLRLEIHSSTLVDELADPIPHTSEHGTVTIRGVAQDVNPPTTTASLSGLEGTSGWFTSDVLVTLFATDDVSGVDQTEYSLDNSTWVTYTSPFTVSDEGTTILYVRSTDNVGNVESTAARTIEMDKTPPEADAGDDQTVNVGATVILDGGGSADNLGIVDYEWVFGDGSTGQGKTAVHTYSDPGMYTVALTVKDDAGNTAAHSITITVESLPPELPLWVIGAVVAGILVIAALAIVLWIRRK